MPDYTGKQNAKDKKVNPKRKADLDTSTVAPSIVCIANDSNKALEILA